MTVRLSRAATERKANPRERIAVGTPYGVAGWSSSNARGEENGWRGLALPDAQTRVCEEPRLRAWLTLCQPNGSPTAVGTHGSRDLVPVAMQAARFQTVKPAMPVLTCSIFPKEGKYIVLKKTLTTKTRE